MSSSVSRNQTKQKNIFRDFRINLHRRKNSKLILSASEARTLSERAYFCLTHGADLRVRIQRRDKNAD